jgi:hypothetical protein
MAPLASHNPLARRNLDAYYQSTKLSKISVAPLKSFLSVELSTLRFRFHFVNRNLKVFKFASRPRPEP